MQKNIWLIAVALLSALCVAFCVFAIWATTTKISANASDVISARNKIFAYVDENTGQIDCEKLMLKNNTEFNYALDSIAVAVDDQTKIITDLSDARITIEGLGGKIYEGDVPKAQQKISEMRFK